MRKDLNSGKCVREYGEESGQNQGEWEALRQGSAVGSCFVKVCFAPGPKNRSTNSNIRSSDV